MSDLFSRLRWTIVEHQEQGPDALAKAIIRELESTHCVVEADLVTDAMLDACFSALPEHYDPPDPKRRLWHAFKAKRRYSAMAKAAPKIMFTLTKE